MTMTMTMKMWVTRSLIHRVSTRIYSGLEGHHTQWLLQLKLKLKSKTTNDVKHNGCECSTNVSDTCCSSTATKSTNGNRSVQVRRTN
jgi:hypothetical protein